MEDVVSKPIDHKKKHEYKLVVAQLVELLGKDVLKLFGLFGTLLVHEILIAALVLVSTVKVSPRFQKVFISKGVVLRYASGERGELVSLCESFKAARLEQ